MNIPQAQIIDQTSAERLIDEAINRNWDLSYLPKKHQLLIEDPTGWLAKVYLPWQMDWKEETRFSERPDSHFSLVLIRAGQAATGYFHRGGLIDHKVFRAYLVRQKQGVSQIKHLKTKGKSRAGSRIRLAETERFFMEINERLNSYAERFPIDLWGISCAKTMWPYYFDSEIAPPFSSKDPNLLELPIHIAQASLEELIAAGQLVQRFHLIYSDRGREILGQNDLKDAPSKNEDDW
jgi:hypothetical protein